MPKETSSVVASTAGRVLADETASSDAKRLAGSALSQVRGIDKPFSAKEAKETEGVDSETGLFDGVDPDTKERVSVSVEGLKAEFGDELGEKKYLEIAGVNGGSVFFNPYAEATSYRPPLGISKVPDDVKPKIAAILAAEE